MIKFPKLQFVGALFKRLSKREKACLYIALTFIFFIGIDRLVVNPISLKMESLDRELDDKEAVIRKNLRILALKDKITATSMKYAPLVNKVEFGEQEVSSLLKKIENLASKKSVNILNIKPQGKKDYSLLKTYLVVLNCESSMQHLLEFMYSIESASDLLIISKFQVSPKAKGSDVAVCSMSIHKIIVE